MKDSIYTELFTLVRKDGERLIVIDPETDEGVVVIRLSEFKKLTNKNSEITVEQISDKSTEDEPTLAKNVPQNLSFWDHSKEEKAHHAGKLDNKHDSGRIHEHKSAYASEKDERNLISETEDEPAGEEYYFEPVEEIGL